MRKIMYAVLLALSMMLNAAFVNAEGKPVSGDGVGMAVKKIFDIGNVYPESCNMYFFIAYSDNTGIPRRILVTGADGAKFVYDVPAGQPRWLEYSTPPINEVTGWEPWRSVTEVTFHCRQDDRK